MTLLTAGSAGTTAAGAPVPTPACPASLAPGGHDYHGLTLVKCNFSGLDLRKASFKGATLTAVVFVRANLSGADFSGATFADSGNAVFPNDFSFADLTQASFGGARFDGLTYLTYATLTSADFSRTDVSNGNAVFGEKLRFDATATPRLDFTGSTLNCEFVPQWAALNLSGATGLNACGPQLQKFDFSKAQLAGADLSGLDLRQTRWGGAQLSGTNFQDANLDGALGLNGAAQTVLKGALFNRASVRFVDFSSARLNGASFTRADLEGTDFGNADLSADPDAPSGTAASFDNAHLRNVSLAGATLNSVTFLHASLYGTALGAPASVCRLARAGCSPAEPRTGATCSCASASGADLTDTDFSNAFLYGVDFSTRATVVNATRFDGAILVSANFADASFMIDPTHGGKAPSFNGAWLQGVTAPGLGKASLSGAFVDFGVTTNGIGRTGNALHVVLAADYTRFRNWNGASATPCVRLRYDRASALPVDVGTMTCPNGLNYPGRGCGALAPKSDAGAPPNPAWNGGARLAVNQPPGWYQLDSTYEPATSGAAVCANQPEDRSWFSASQPP